ncbi:Tc5 transposase DNA-binding domain-containing protein [Cladophialophora immunda]|nr:Tc5 transposase DNA-binding domain-containing protein [Cladophialophora immunda]
MTSKREARIQQAIQDYQTRKYPSIRAAAAANDVNYATLSRRLRGTQSATLAHEPQQLLSNIQEELLKRWILDLEAQGHAPSYPTVRVLAGIVSESSGGPSQVGHNWLPRFIQRHPEIRSKIRGCKPMQEDPVTPNIPEG